MTAPSLLMTTLAQVQQWLAESGLPCTLHGDPATPLLRVHTDTRSLQPGDLFVALRGDRFDANDFLAQARASGAVAAIAHHGLEAAGLAGVQVSDSRLALGELARCWRKQWAADAHKPLIAVTGSNGKTTVTQMIASILRAHAGDQSLATQGNFNNDIGLPLTLLRLRPAHRCAVVEMGMNHPGEIAALARIAQPTVALVNNAQREHQEFMATVEAVARENGSVFAALPADGVAVFPAEDAYTPLWRELAANSGTSSAENPAVARSTGATGQRRTLTFGWNGRADVHGSARWANGGWEVLAHTPAGDLSFTLNIAGRHNVLNALAACASALAAGVPLAAIAQGLSAFQAVKGRSRSLSLAGGVSLVDDTYNANPDSVRAAIDVLAELPGPRLLALGDMGEVGDQGPQFHEEVGAYARERGIEHVLCLGALCRHTATALPQGEHFDDIAALLLRLEALRPSLRSILVKGSRFMKMERVIEHLNPTGESASHAA